RKISEDQWKFVYLQEYWILDGTNLFLLIKEAVLSEAEGGVGGCSDFDFRCWIEEPVSRNELRETSNEFYSVVKKNIRRIKLKRRMQ
ncbi:MAG: hypothetical protein KAS58_03560, partial [Calditrichia bacterium]|nr:hypothetical protein [Calditrichia bacterium]